VNPDRGFCFDINQWKENCFKGSGPVQVGIKFNE
jgi:hypothetical protein